MGNKIDLLKNLIEESDATPQIKINKIIQALQRTEDIIKAKALSQKILDGDFSNLKEKSIDDILEAFNNGDTKTKTFNSRIINDKKEIDDFGSNKEETLKYELQVAKKQIELLEKSFNEKIKELETRNERNEKLLSKLMLTRNSSLIEVSDDDINELYLRYMQNEETTHNDAFIINNIIPKSYYKIK